MTVMPGGDNVDYQRCELVGEIVAKILELDPPTIKWMTAEFAARMNHAFMGAYTMIQMEMLKSGASPDEAKEQAGQEAMLLAFQLGIQVGTEMEAGRAMRELFGE